MSFAERIISSVVYDVNKCSLWVADKVQSDERARVVCSSLVDEMRPYLPPVCDGISVASLI